MASGIYDVDGKIRLTQSPGTGFCGLYAPDGSYYYTLAPGSGFCGSIAPDGSWYVTDASGAGFGGLYAPNGSLRITTLNEWNGALRVSGSFGPTVVANFIQSTYALNLAALSSVATFSRADATPIATYFDSSGLLKTVATATGPRFTYYYNGSAWAAAGLTIEGPRTNLSFPSRDFAGSWSVQNVTLTNGAASSIDGTSGMTKVQASAGTAVHSFYKAVSVTANTTLAKSFVFAPGTSRYVFISYTNTSTKWVTAVFDLQGGGSAATQTAAGAGGTFVDSFQETFGSGFVRCTLVGQIQDASGAFEVGFAGAATGNTFNGFGEISTTAAGTEYFYADYSQSEVGVSSSSIIVTTSGSVARAAEVVTAKAPFATYPTTGSVIIEVGQLKTTAGTKIFIGQGTPSLGRLYANSSPAVAQYNGSSALLGASLNPVYSTNRVGVTWTPSSRSITANGQAPTSDGNTFSTNFAGAALIGSNYGSASYLEGNVAAIAFYTQEIPTAEFRSKTTVGAAF